MACVTSYNLKGVRDKYTTFSTWEYSSEIIKEKIQLTQKNKAGLQAPDAIWFKFKVKTLIGITRAEPVIANVTEPLLPG